MGWFNSVKNPKIKNVKKQNDSIPVGLWKKCIGCSEILQANRLSDNLNVCPMCDHHYRVSAKERLDLMVDENSFKEEMEVSVYHDPLLSGGYQGFLRDAFRISNTQEGWLRTQVYEAVKQRITD